MADAMRKPLLRQEELRDRAAGSPEYAMLSLGERAMLDLLIEGHSPIDCCGYASMEEWRKRAGARREAKWRLSRAALERLRELGFIRGCACISGGELAVASWGELAQGSP